MLQSVGDQVGEVVQLALDACQASVEAALLGGEDVPDGGLVGDGAAHVLERYVDGTEIVCCESSAQRKDCGDVSVAPSTTIGRPTGNVVTVTVVGAAP